MKTPKSYVMTMPELIRSINTTMSYLQQEGEIANISEVLDEYDRVMTVNNFTKDQVHVEWQKQFN